MAEEFVFLVPDFEVEAGGLEARSDSGVERRADPDLDRHAKKLSLRRRAREVSIKPEQLESFWKDKVVGMTQTLTKAEAEKKTDGFRVAEIAFSLGVGAKGGLAFVAEGSVEATISVTLRRADSASA